MYTSFWLPNLHSDTVSTNREEFEINKFTKNRSEYYHTFTKNPLSALAVNFQEMNYICKQHINDTSNIQITTFVNNNLSEDPEKTNLGTVKMMEAKCEVIVRIYIVSPDIIYRGVGAVSP